LSLKRYSITLDAGETAQAAYCIGVAMRQFMLENFNQGKPITDESIEELTHLQERLERVH